MRRAQQNVWTIVAPALSIPLSARTTQFITTPIIPLVANRKLLLWNIATTSTAQLAADTLKIAADAVQLSWQLNDLNGQFITQGAIAGNPWQQGSLIPFNSAGVANGLTVALAGDPILELRGNMALMNPQAGVSQVVASVLFFAGWDLHNTDAAAAHAVLSSLQVLVSEEGIE
jgi:hypothetical protein